MKTVTLQAPIKTHALIFFPIKSPIKQDGFLFIHFYVAKTRLHGYNVKLLLRFKEQFYLCLDEKYMLVGGT